MHEKFVKKELKEHYFSLQKVKKEQREWDSNPRSHGLTLAIKYFDLKDGLHSNLNYS